jgi:hypothetical protein
MLQRFYRSDKIRNTPGIGLGLNLVSAIGGLGEFALESDRNCEQAVVLRRTRA